MGDKPNFRSMGEDPLEDPIDMANPESSDLRDKGLVTSLQVSILPKFVSISIKFYLCQTKIYFCTLDLNE